MIGFFVAVIAAFLYAPHFWNTFPHRQSLNVCIFTETFTPEAIALFEKKTGIKVNITYVETDNQIYARFRINQGEGYDVVNVSDYLVAILKKEGWLRQINHSSITNFDQLDQRLMHHKFDYNNDYCMPHKWYVYGIVYDTKFFPQKPEKMSLAYLFQNPKELFQSGKVKAPYKICMLDDHLDVTYLTAIYLGKDPNNLNAQDLEEIKKILVTQKQWVEAYSVHSVQYFLFSEVVPVALTSSNYMRRMLDASNRFNFAVPKEGSILVIENLAIPRLSTKAELAQQFIDFMLSEEIATLNSSTYGYNSSHTKAINTIDARYFNNKNLCPDDKMFIKLSVPVLPTELKKIVEDMWLYIGFA